jgi:hypothetical protein
MKQPKIRVVGALRWTESYGLGGAIFENLFGRDTVLHLHPLEEGTTNWFEPRLLYERGSESEPPPEPDNSSIKQRQDLMAPWYKARSSK